MTHEPHINAKDSGDTDDDGRRIQSFEMFRATCSCGWRGQLCTDAEGAERSYDRHMFGLVPA